MQRLCDIAHDDASSESSCPCANPHTDFVAGHAHVSEEPTIVEIASTHTVSPQQVSLAWHLARGTAAVPKSTDAGRQKANLLVSYVRSGKRRMISTWFSFEYAGVA